MQQSSWKEESPTPWPSLQNWEGAKRVTASAMHVRKSRNIYMVTAVFEHQCDLLRKRWSLIWSRIQDITSSFIYSRIWHYTTAISLHSAKDLSLQQAMKKKCQKHNINTWKYFHFLPAMVAVQGKHWLQYHQSSQQGLHLFLHKLALWDDLHWPGTLKHKSWAAYFTS